MVVTAAATIGVTTAATKVVITAAMATMEATAITEATAIMADTTADITAVTATVIIIINISVFMSLHIVMIHDDRNRGPFGARWFVDEISILFPCVF